MKLNMSMNNKEITENLLLEFSKHDKSIIDVIEILSNVMVQTGFSNIEKYSDALESVANDVKSNGDTLHNALARQGMLMLTWLKSEEKNV